MTETQPATIYVIAYVSWRESYGYSGDWEVLVETEDWGFFLSEDAAQKKVNALNEYDAKYAIYVKGTEATNAQLLESYEERMVAWNLLADSGLQASQFMKTPTYRPSAVKSFEEWKSNRGHESYYEVQTVRRSNEDA